MESSTAVFYPVDQWVHIHCMQFSIMNSPADFSSVLLHWITFLYFSPIKEWIRRTMEIPPMPLFKIPDQPALFEFRSPERIDRRPFDPVQQVNKIGDNQFTFENLSELPLDWKELLQSEIGLTKTSFQLLLSHRHDMQEEAYLEESEKKSVRVLRAKYNLDKADFV